MKIISLNVNSFMGIKTSISGKGADEIIQHSYEYEGLRYDESITDFDIRYCNQNSIKKIFEIIDEEKPEVVILHEYRRNFPSAIEFEKKMKESGYSEPLTHKKKGRYKYGFSTAFFVKSGLSYKDEKDIFNPLTISLSDRVYSIEMSEIIIIGIHIPLNREDGLSIREDTWDEVLHYIEDVQDRRIAIIGDFNTYDKTGKNAEAYEKKERLIQNGYFDVWLEMGQADNTPTQKPNLSRLDYAFITKTLLKKIKMRMIPENDNEFISDEWSLSDHRMLVIEIEEDKNMAIEKVLTQAITKMFPDGGETYTYDDIRRIFEEEGVDVSDFDSVLNECIKGGWITDCGDNNYTR